MEMMWTARTRGAGGGGAAGAHVRYTRVQVQTEHEIEKMAHRLTDIGLRRSRGARMAQSAFLLLLSVCCFLLAIEMLLQLL